MHVAPPSVWSVPVDSKRSEVGRQRRGSNPARQNPGEKSTTLRAEIFALPLKHAHRPTHPRILLAPLLGYRLLAISLASPVFFPQILNPILRLGRLTGGTSHEIIGQITAAVPVDLGPEPI